MGRYSSDQLDSPVRGRRSLRTRSLSQRGRFPARYRSSQRTTPHVRNNSCLRTRSPAREKLSSCARSPKRAKFSSTVSRSPSPQTKHLRRAQAEREVEKITDREHEENSGREAYEARHRERHSDREVPSKRRPARDKNGGGSSRSRHEQSTSPTDGHQQNRYSSRSPPRAAKTGAHDEVLDLLIAMHSQRKGISGQSSSIHPPASPSERATDTPQPSSTQVGGNDNNSSSCSGKKRGRGPTRGLSLLAMLPGERIPVEFNQEGQPIGEYASKFSNLCGVTARNPDFAPLQVKKWTDVPEHAKEKMWRHIQKHAEVGDERRKWVLQSLGKKFKDRKKKLKDNYYSKWKTDEERLEHPPPDVSKADWTWLVQYWSSPKAQAVAERNKVNRSHQTLKHTGGTKSFARYKDEETRSRTDGSIPTRADLFIRTHTRKDGKAVDDRSEKIISKFKELLATPEDGSCSSIGDDIYTQMMGLERHGRVRGYGLGPTPTSVFGSMSSQTRINYEKMRTQLDDMRQQMEDLKTKHSEEMRTYIEEVERKQDEVHRKQEEMQRKQGEMLEMMQQMMSHQRQHRSDGGAD